MESGTHHTPESRRAIADGVKRAHAEHRERDKRNHYAMAGALKHLLDIPDRTDEQTLEMLELAIACRDTAPPERRAIFDRIATALGEGREVRFT